MPAPANDNFSAAALLSNDVDVISSGNVFGTVTGATVESGEPGNTAPGPLNVPPAGPDYNGHTVWYSYTYTNSIRLCPPSPVCFSTRYQGACADLPAQVRTRLQVFTGSAVNALTEIAYLPNANWVAAYANWDFGSLVAFTPVSGQQYWIRVDSTSSGNEGDFQLLWGPYFNQRVADCGTCQADASPENLCVGQLSFPNLVAWGTDESTIPSDPFINVEFGGLAYPAGQYRVSYCGGAYRFEYDRSDAVVSGYENSSPQPWMVDVGYDPSAEEGYSLQNTFFAVWFNNDDTGTEANTIGLTYPNKPVGSYGFATQVDAENAHACGQAVFTHTGGLIGMAWKDAPATDNANGTPPPSFKLSRIYPLITAVSSCASWTGAPAATCTFNVNCPNTVGWSGVTVTLDAAGGISSSSTLTAQTIAPGGNAYTLTFDATSPNVTASLRFSSPQFPADVVVEFFLGPVLQIQQQDLIGGWGSGVQLITTESCGSVSVNRWRLHIYNLGAWTEDPSVGLTVTVTCPTAVVVDMGSCVAQLTAPASNISGPFLCSNPTGAALYQYVDFDILASVTSTTAVMNFYDSGTLVGTIPFPIPA